MTWAGRERSSPNRFPDLPARDEEFDAMLIPARVDLVRQSPLIDRVTIADNRATRWIL